MREPPFIEDRACDCARGAGDGAGLDVVDQPLLEYIRLRIVTHGPLEQLAPNGQPNRVGGLIAFTGAAAPIGSVARGEQRGADPARSEDVHYYPRGANGVALSAGIDAPSATPVPAGRRKPRSTAARSNSTLPRSVARTWSEGVACSVKQDLR